MKIKLKMGSLFSSEEETTVENTGNSNTNNVIIGKPIELDHFDVILCIYLITLIVVIRAIYTAYKIHQKSLKKKYNKTQPAMAL